MNRPTFLLVAAVGALLYGSLYLAGVFVIGLTTHNPDAALLAIATAGVTYLSLVSHLIGGPPPIATTLTLLSILSGAVAGSWLIW